MVVLLPHPDSYREKCFILGILSAVPFHHPKHPFLAAFALMLLNGLPPSDGSMFFHVPHNVFKVFAMCADDHMDMTAHNAPTINFESFVLLVPIAIGISNF